MYRLLNVYHVSPIWVFTGGIIEIQLHWINEETDDEILTYGEMELKPL